MGNAFLMNFSRRFVGHESILFTFLFFSNSDSSAEIQNTRLDNLRVTVIIKINLADASTKRKCKPINTRPVAMPKNKRPHKQLTKD